MSALDYSTLQTSAAECADKSNVHGHVTVYAEGEKDTQLDAVEYIRRLEERERVAQSQMEILKSQVQQQLLCSILPASGSLALKSQLQAQSISCAQIGSIFP